MFNTIWQPVMQSIMQHIQACKAEPTQTIVLLPFAQLLPMAKQQWALAYPNSLAPRFETTNSWANRIHAFNPGQDDITFDAAYDLLTAQRLLHEAGCKKDAHWLAGMVCESAIQLAPIAAAQAPNKRPTWANEMQQKLLSQGTAPHYEQRITSVALLWAGHSSYASDILFQAIETTQALVVLSGLKTDALTDTLMRYMQQHKPQVLTVFTDWYTTNTINLPAAHIQYTNDLEEQAQRAAASVQDAVVRNADNENTVVALIDNDRALSRRIRAILAAQGLAIRDETGWKLSTTVAASHIMAILQACIPKASSDQVISWLKRLPCEACPKEHIDAIEAYLRKLQLAQWPTNSFWNNWNDDAFITVQQIQTWRQQLQSPRPLKQWLADLSQILNDIKQWTWFEQDQAGLSVLRALHWQNGCINLPDTQNWSLSTFAQWVRHTLENNQFKPQYPSKEQVILVPLSQILARPFAAVVMPGCDEKRLPSAPEPSGIWTTKQRAVLGLSSREQLQYSQLLGWQHLLSFNQVELLTSNSENGVELITSPLLLEWQLAPEGISKRALTETPDLRTAQTITSKNLPPITAVGDRILPQTISASSYQRLSICPYCFFVFELLKLREINELQDDVDKRDFGSWLHKTLQLFHKNLQTTHRAKLPSAETLRNLLEQSGQEAKKLLRLDKASFLPYQSALRQVFNGYIKWLEQDHKESQAQFLESEKKYTRLLSEFIDEIRPDLSHIKLVGRIDRTDSLPSKEADKPSLRLIDYKTERPDKTKKRITNTQEDIQLAFYAALLSPKAVRAAYLNIGTDGKVQLLEPDYIPEQGQEIVEEIYKYLQDIADGKPLPALGQAPQCRCCTNGINRSELMQERS